MKKTRDDQIARDEAEARKLGLSYGVYSAYKESGYLEKYLLQKIREAEKPKENITVINSNIIGAAGKGQKASRDDQKVS